MSNRRSRRRAKQDGEDVIARLQEEARWSSFTAARLGRWRVRPWAYGRMLLAFVAVSAAFLALVVVVGLITDLLDR